MLEINSFNQGADSGANGRLQRDVTFPEGQRCAELQGHISIPVKNSTGASKDFTNAELVAILTTVLGSTTMRFGRKAVEVVDDALTFPRMRAMYIAATGLDFEIEGGTLTSPIQLNLFDNSVYKFTVANGETKTLIIVFTRPFRFHRLAPDQFIFTPGTTQMRQLQWDFVRGASPGFPANCSQDGAASYTIVADTVPGEDVWAQVYRLVVNETDGKESAMPSGGGALLAGWEETATGAATTLGLFSLLRKGDEPIHDAIQFPRVIDQAKRRMPVGDYDLNALYSQFFALPERSELDEVPTAEGFTFVQHSVTLSPPKTVWLHVPELHDGHADSHIGANVASEKGAEVKVFTPKADRITARLASVVPVQLIKRDSPKFNLVPGRLYQNSGGGSPKATLHLPQGMANALAAAMQNAGSEEGAHAIAAEYTAMISKSVPGGTSPGRNDKTRAMSEVVARTILPASFHGAISGILAKVRNLGQVR